jgi:hypothetical protein
MTRPEPALRAEAEAVADAARERLRERDPTSRLAQSIKIIELEAGDHPAFAVGTDEAAGFFLEFGTARRRASPWLVPALHFALKGQPRHPIWLTVVDGETSR